MMNKSVYLLREAVVSAVINALISVAFFVGFFRGIDPIPVWGMNNYAFDFIPQSFAVSLMSAQALKQLCVLNWMARTPSR